jgi:hypothetical protein
VGDEQDAGQDQHDRAPETERQVHVVRARVGQDGLDSELDRLAARLGACQFDRVQAGFEVGGQSDREGRRPVSRRHDRAKADRSRVQHAGDRFAGVEVVGAGAMTVTVKAPEKPSALVVDHVRVTGLAAV